MSQIIDIGGLFEKSWKLFKDNLNFSIGVGVIYLVVSVFLGVAGELIKLATGVSEEALMDDFSIEKFSQFLPVFLIITFVSIVVSVILKLGVIKVFLSLVGGGKPNFNDLWSAAHYLPKYLGTVLLMAVPIIVGFILFILPGFYLYIRWQFFSILIIDKNLGPIEALKESWRLTHGRVVDMFLAFALMTALVLGGSLAFGVGIIFTLPLAIIFLASLYRIVNPLPALGV